MNEEIKHPSTKDAATEPDKGHCAPANGSEARCRLVIAVGKDRVVLPCDMPRDYAEALGRVVEQMGAVTWYLPPNVKLCDGGAKTP